MKKTSRRIFSRADCSRAEAVLARSLYAKEIKNLLLKTSFSERDDIFNYV